MAFWSSQTLEGRLDQLVDSPNKDLVDCNAVTLRIGREIYITPGLEQPAPNSHTKQLLDANAPFAIPPGQFAFLLTEEVVTIPPEAMGFISIKATYKLRGLVNVSGFHVDRVGPVRSSSRYSMRAPRRCISNGAYRCSCCGSPTSMRLQKSANRHAAPMAFRRP